jgi:Excalibur calcium-binding domain
MPRSSTLVSALVGFVVAASCVEAAPLNKCIVDGTVTYQQGLCPSNEVRKQPTIEELNAAEKKRRAAAAAAPPEKLAPAAATGASPERVVPATIASGFSCDGRQYCSQMNSCAEAKYFLANCPGVKMDGDRNGIPCEKQWCNR